MYQIFLRGRHRGCFVCCGDDGGGVVSRLEAGGRRLILSEAESDFWRLAARYKDIKDVGSHSLGRDLHPTKCQVILTLAVEW